MRIAFAALLLAIGCEGVAPEWRWGDKPVAIEAIGNKPTPAPPRAEWEMLARAWHHPSPIPNFELVDQEGASFRLNRLAGAYVLIGFIFTTCSVPKACPLTTQKMYDVGKLWAVREKAGTTGDRKLHLLSLTIDPENDTPAVLRSYSEALRHEVPGWTLATGPEELMQQALPGMFGARARPDGQGSITHTVKAALLAPGLRPIQDWEDNAFEPEDVIELVMK